MSKIKKEYEEYDFKGFKGLPTKIIYDTTKGAKRKPPYKYMDNIVLKEKVFQGKKIKDFTKKEKQTYDRLAQRKNYQNQKAKEYSGITAKEYKTKIGKKLKDFSKTEMMNYNKLSKREERFHK